MIEKRLEELKTLLNEKTKLLNEYVIMQQQLMKEILMIQGAIKELQNLNGQKIKK